jgi:hopanoid-associated phosphorylase
MSLQQQKFIGVICGLKSEAEAVAYAVGKSRIRIGVSGANAARAEEIARQFCNERASAIISVGVSGGLDPALKSGDLVIGSSVIGDDLYVSDPYLLRVVKDALQGSALIAPLYGADEIIDSVWKKATFYQNHGAVAVDMESHGAARAAARAGVPFLAIRAIADPADRALPAAALNAVAADGSTRVIATLAAAMRDPKQFPELMKLGADSNAALKTLRRDLGPIFSGLFLSLDL